MMEKVEKRKEIFEMATFSSNPEKRYSSVDPILVLVSIALLSILVAFGPLNGNRYSSRGSAVVTQGGAADKVSISVGTFFAADLEYWDANCSRGWKSNSTCDALVASTQSCLTGMETASAYCSEYATYLQQFRGQ
jgi:hypothetical protein